MSSRSTNLDAMRALAALYVLVGHAYLLSGSVIGFTDRDPFRLAINTGAAGVWLFFALSGYLISAPFVRSLFSGAPLPDIRSFVIRRGLRIYPAYLVTLAVVVWFGLAPGTSVSPGRAALHAALLHNLVPGEQQAVFFGAWTLTLEVLFYALVPVVAWTVRRLHPGPIELRALGVGVAVTWMASIAFVAVVGPLGDPATSVWLRILFPSMLSMFCPGVAVAVAVCVWRADAPPRWFSTIARRRRESLAVAVGLAVLGAYGATTTNVRVYDASRQLFALASGIALVLALTRPALAGRTGRVLGELGLISYGVYLGQGVVVSVLVRHPSVIALRHTGGTAYLVHVVYLVGLTLPLAWLSWTLIERPAIRWGHRHAGELGRRPGRLGVRSRVDDGDAGAADRGGAGHRRARAPVARTAELRIPGAAPVTSPTWPWATRTPRARSCSPTTPRGCRRTAASRCSTTPTSPRRRSAPRSFADVSCGSATLDDLYEPQGPLPIGGDQRGAARRRGPGHRRRDPRHGRQRRRLRRGSPSAASACSAPRSRRRARPSYLSGGRDRVSERIAAVGPELGRALDDIHAKAPAAQVFVVSYPDRPPRQRRRPAGPTCRSSKPTCRTWWRSSRR